MYSATHENTLLLKKMGFGLLAVVLNIYCDWLFFQRAAAKNDD
jgi:hypothetical protein